MTATIGIALGGGGAKGLCHVSMLGVLDELGVRPHMIAGTSIGAIIGAIYASGRTADEIRTGLDALTAVPRSFREVISAAKQLPSWLDFVGVEVGRSSLLKVDTFLGGLQGVLGVSTFEQLRIPLKVVAADFWAREEVVIDAGPVIPAIAASFAMPGIFKPVVLDGRVLVDGGSVNPLPYDLLFDACDVVIAVDVIGRRTRRGDLLPSYTETLFNSFQIAEKTILREKMKARPPTIYVEPEIHDVRVLEFHKAERIYEQAAPARERLKRSLAALLG
jgi:NTE family protein